MEYSVNFQQVVNNKQYTSATRLLCYEIMNQGYANIGEFFKNMPQADLDKYLEITDDPEGDPFDEIVLLVGILSTAEGIDVDLAPTDESAEIMASKCTHLSMLFLLEDMHRKGVVKLHHENISFGEDMGDKVLVEKLID